MSPRCFEIKRQRNTLLLGRGDGITMHVQLDVLLGFPRRIGGHTGVSASIFHQGFGNL